MVDTAKAIKLGVTSFEFGDQVWRGLWGPPDANGGRELVGLIRKDLVERFEEFLSVIRRRRVMTSNGSPVSILDLFEEVVPVKRYIIRALIVKHPGWPTEREILEIVMGVAISRARVLLLR